MVERPTQWKRVLERLFFVGVLFAVGANPLRANAGDDGLGALNGDQKAALVGLLKSGNDHYDQGELEAALTDLDAAAQLADIPLIHYRRALCFEKLERYEESIQAYEYYLANATDLPDRARIEKDVERLRVKWRESTRTTLNLTTTPPGATVFLEEDQRMLGTTPLQLTLTHKQVTLHFSLEGYEERKETIVLTPGHGMSLAVDLVPPTTLNVTSSPLGADVRLASASSEVVGQTPLQLNVEPGPIEVFVSLEGHVSMNRVIDAVEGEAAALAFEMRAPDTSLQTAGWVTLGSGVLVGAGLAVVWVLAEDKTVEANDYSRQEPTHDRVALNDRRSEAQTLRTTTFVMAGLTAAVLATGATLLTLYWQGSEGGDSEPAVALGAAGTQPPRRRIRRPPSEVLMRELREKRGYFTGAVAFFALSSTLCGCFSDLLDKHCTHDGHCFTNERCIERVCTKVDDVAETAATFSVCVQAVDADSGAPIVGFIACTDSGQTRLGSTASEYCFDVTEEAMRSGFKVGASIAGYELEETSLNELPTGPVILELEPCQSTCSMCGQ